MTSRKLSGLFINCVEAQDSIFESGKMVFECLLNSDKYSLDYVELIPDNTKISANYDFYLFNYHISIMNWLDTTQIKKLLPGVKMTIVLEVSPNDPFVMCSPDDFDAYCVLDPTLNIDVENAFAFPRPLEKFDEPDVYQPKEVPVIGSFGFATPGKGFEHIIDAVNREFEKAVVRINIPYGAYTNDDRTTYAHGLAQMCKDKAKIGIEVVVTHDYMTKPELVKWCGENTLNCFLYDRNQPGLAATTDQAITSGRPLITSKNNTFRHIQKFIKPFPYQSLRSAIENTGEIVKEIQQAWSAEKFRERFEEVLDNFQFDEFKSENIVTLPTVPIPKRTKIGLIQNLRDAAALKTRTRNLVNGRGFVRAVRSEPPPVISYSGFGEDIIINDFFNSIPIKSVSYLDIRENGFESVSNSYFFYEKGFRGVLVEPNPYLCGKLKGERPDDTLLNYGIGANNEVRETDLFLFSDKPDGLSTFSLEEARQWEETDGKNHKVKRIWKIPLLDINEAIENYLTECPDLVSIYVKNRSLEILKTFDFEKHSPAAFCIEKLTDKKGKSAFVIQEIDQIFEENGYFLFQETSASSIFINQYLYDFYIYQKSRRQVESPR